MVLLAMGLPILVWLVVVAAVVQFDFQGLKFLVLEIDPAPGVLGLFVTKKGIYAS